jgi:hypothetical protein
MDGLSHWDLLLLFVVAYIAVMAMVRMMLHHRSQTLVKLRDQLAVQQRRKNSAARSDEPRRDTA